MERAAQPLSRHERWAPITAGIICAIIAFASAFPVVLAGLAAVGASPGQAASGLLAVTVMMGALSVLLSLRHRMPITSAWSTPGAALLMTTGAVVGGWPAAVGAFIVCGVLLTLTGLWPGLARLIQRIPAPIAQAMLAGVLLPLCAAPVAAIVANPVAVAPVVLVWLVLLRLLPKWAVPGMLIAALVVIGVSLASSGESMEPAALLPHLEWTTPTFSLQALLGIALPLYVVTMASQNIPGVAVMAGLGFTVPWRSALTSTGIGSVLVAPFGGHAVNLAAISAALAAGEDAGRHDRRWIAGVTAGCTAIVIGVLSTALVAVVLLAPECVIATVAGIALMGTFASSAASALRDADHRIPSAVTLVIAASGIAVFGLSSAFWALAAGIAVHLALPKPVAAPGGDVRPG